MEQYVKVEKPKVETPIDENEIRITSQGRMRSYISYALTLLQEKNANEIVFKAMGRAINKTVTIVELIKRRIVGLHQITSIGSTDITDTWEPLEEGLLPLETTRHVSMITIILSKNDMDTSAVGYQPPLPADQVKPSNDYDFDGEGSPSARGRGPGGRGRGGRGRGRGRGPIGNGFASLEYEDSGWDQNRDYPRGRGRGRGRNFRGRGRGGYGYSGPTDDSQQFDGGYNRGPPGQGGRGRGGYSYNGPIEDNQEFDRGYNRGLPGQGGLGRGRHGYDGPIDDNQQFDGGYSGGRDRGGRRGGRGRGGGRSSGPAQAVVGGT